MSIPHKMDAVTYQNIHQDDIEPFFDIDFSSDESSSKLSDEDIDESVGDESVDGESDTEFSSLFGDGLVPNSLLREKVVEVLHTDDGVFLNEISCSLDYLTVLGFRNHIKPSYTNAYKNDITEYAAPPNLSRPSMNGFEYDRDNSNLARKCVTQESDNRNLAKNSSDSKSENLAKKFTGSLMRSLSRKPRDNLALKSGMEANSNRCQLQFKRKVGQFLREGHKYLKKLKKLCEFYYPDLRKHEKLPFDHIMEVVFEIYSKSDSFFEQMQKISINEHNIIPILDQHLDIYELYVLFNRTRNKARHKTSEEQISWIKFTFDSIDNQIQKHLAAFTDWKPFVIEGGNISAFSKIINRISNINASKHEKFVIDKIKYNPFTSTDHGQIIRTFYLRVKIKGRHKKCQVIIFEKLIIFATQTNAGLQFLDFITLDSIQNIKEENSFITSYTFKVIITLAPDFIKFGQKYIELSSRHKYIISSCNETLLTVVNSRPYII